MPMLRDLHLQVWATCFTACLSLSLSSLRAYIWPWIKNTFSRPPPPPRPPPPGSRSPTPCCMLLCRGLVLRTFVANAWHGYAPQKNLVDKVLVASQKILLRAYVAEWPPKPFTSAVLWIKRPDCHHTLFMSTLGFQPHLQPYALTPGSPDASRWNTVTVALEHGCPCKSSAATSKSVHQGEFSILVIIIAVTMKSACVMKAHQHSPASH